ncbi:MAG: site-specific integrase, partial [Campylobacterota bacterium]|nr:site-specific integrase [Campylobacterota bacterium]
KGITEPFCNQKRNELINSIKLGTDAPIKYKKATGVLFDVIAIKYFDDLQVHSTPHTIRDVTSKYNKHIKEPLGSLIVDRIKIEDLEKFQKSKIGILADKTINQLVELFSTIFNFGLRKDMCKTVNPAIKLKKFKIDNARERYLEKDEIKELFELLKDNELLTLFTKLSLSTGARLETVLSIQKKDIDLPISTVTLQDFKNKDTYKGFLSDDVLAIIKKKIKNYKANDYIVSLDGTKITSRQIQSRLKPKIDKLFNDELDTRDRKNRIVIHSLRHTFASHLAINGTPIFTIQKLMNHKDIKQTMRYAKLAPDSGKEFVNELYK